MEHDIGAKEVSGSERKKQAEQELRFDEALSNMSIKWIGCWSIEVSTNTIINWLGIAVI